MLEILKEATDKNKAFGTLADLLKDFDCFNHDLLIAKLYAYGLNINTLNILQDYLSNRQQRIKVDSLYSSLETILSVVPGTCLLGPLLFNMFVCDKFLMLSNTYFTGYAGDNLSFAVRENIADVIKVLEEIGETLGNWFSNNEITINTDKHHLVLNS